MRLDSEADFETTVAVLLAQRANRAVVETDAILPAVGHARGRPTRWWLAVAAVLVIAGGMAVTFRDVGPLSDSIGAASEPGNEQATNAYDLVIWMEVGVDSTNVSDLAALLDSWASVEEFVYVDQAATWSEFVEYFADEPEIIELVEPENLPTSFKVRTDAPGSVVGLVTGQAGVDEVEVATLDD